MTVHGATHKLHQAYADLALAEKEFKELDSTDRKHRGMCFLRNAMIIIENALTVELRNPILEEKL